MVDRLARYDAAIECFEKAKLLYPLKVEPYLYVAITHIRCVCVHK